MLKDYFEVPNKPAIKSGNILSCDFTDHETFIPQPLDYSRDTPATYVDCNGLIKMSGISDTNLVENGTFETPVNNNQWLDFGSPTIAERSQTVAYEGSFSYHIKGDGTNDGTQASASQFAGDYVIGDTIRVRAYVYPITASFNQIRSGVANSNRSITTVVAGLTLNQWNFIEYYAEITTASNNYVSFLINGTAGEFYLDNVSVNKVNLNTPRIDYTTEIGKAKELQKPSLLLEPQATNTATYSNNFTKGDIFNSSGDPNANNSVVTINSITTPDGTNNGWKLTDNNDGSTGAAQLAYYTTNVTSGDTNTFSIFLKKGSTDFAYLSTGGFDSTANGKSYFNLSTGVIALADANHSNVKMEDYGNGWYRCSISNLTTTDVQGSFVIGIATSSGNSNITRDGSNFLYMFGVQAETTGYCTSYIPTSGFTATRNQDLANNAGQLGVFNNEEGVLYAEIASLSTTGSADYISISNGTNNERVVISAHNVLNTIRVFIKSGGSFYSTIDFVASNITEFQKIAFSYKSGQTKLYANGSLVGTSSDSFSLSSISSLQFANGNTTSNPYIGKVKEVKAFRRALTDAELTELTNNIV